MVSKPFLPLCLNMKVFCLFLLCHPFNVSCFNDDAGRPLLALVSKLMPLKAWSSSLLNAYSLKRWLLLLLIGFILVQRRILTWAWAFFLFALASMFISGLGAPWAEFPLFCVGSSLMWTAYSAGGVPCLVGMRISVTWATFLVRLVLH